ncbi:MAG: hypothetical protein NDJ89_00470 [Oligoflexia bacterium]|nr:hypothetical protein [Oligoflexia bacterium]
MIVDKSNQEQYFADVSEAGIRRLSLIEEKMGKSKLVQTFISFVGNGLCLLGGVALAVFVQAILSNFQQ